MGGGIVLGRKEQRKLARQQKKQNKATYYQSRGKKADAAKSGPKAAAKTAAPKKANQKLSNKKNVPVSKRQKIAPVADEEEEDEEIMSDEMVSGASEDESGDAPSSEEDSEEVTVGKRRLPKGYNRYGTDDPILAAAEEALDNGLFDSEGNIDEEGFEGLFGSKFDPNGEDNDVDEDVDVEELTDEESDVDVEEASSNEENSGEEESSEDISSEADSNEDSISEEDEKTSKPVKVVPLIPSEQRLKMVKQVKGLLNRLSLGNFESIATSIEQLYRENSRREMTEVVTELVLAAITTQANLLDSFVLVFASLVSALGHIVGVEFAAYLLQEIVQVLMKNSTNLDSQPSLDDPLAVTPARITMNLVTFLSFLYDLQIVSNKIIGDIIQEAVSRLEELDTEVILKLVRNCGAQFRRDDPSTLKQIILTLNQRVSTIPQSEQSSRFKFMIESIMDLKNNKQKAAAIQQGDLETVKKLLRNLAQQRGISKFEPLRIGLDDIKNADTRGRWWLVGGTWAPEAGKTSSVSSSKKGNDEKSSSLATLAKEQRMNTDVRKAIFSALVSSDDYIDAFQRLLNLKLTSKQERDIVLVILHCCSQEKVYNPFYALVAQKFIQWKHNFLVTFKYAFWDWLKLVDDSPLRKIAHLANFYSHLLSHQALPLVILKKCDFLHLADKEAIFLQMLIGKTLTDASEDSLTAIFENLSARGSSRKVKDGEDQEEAKEEENRSKQDLKVMKAGLKLFFQFYLKEKSPKELPFIKDITLLRKRIDNVSVYLS